MKPKFIITSVCLLVTAGLLLCFLFFGKTSKDNIKETTTEEEKVTTELITTEEVITTTELTTVTTIEELTTTATEEETTEEIATTETVYVEKNVYYEVEETEAETTTEEETNATDTDAVEEEYVEETTENTEGTLSADYDPADFIWMGVIYWGGYRWTYYSQRVLPGGGLDISGRHVDYDGFVCDGDGYICLASNDYGRGTVILTPFGRYGKVYDCGCASGTLDVYCDW